LFLFASKSPFQDCAHYIKRREEKKTEREVMNLGKFPPELRKELLSSNYKTYNIIPDVEKREF